MKKILNFIKEHPYLTFSIIFNLLLGIANSIIYHYILFFIITFYVVILLAIVYLKAKNKFPLFSKVSYIFLNILITGFLIAALSFILLLKLAMSDLGTEYTDIKDYQKALNSYIPETVAHFPAQIPKNATNISMYRSPTSFTGDSDFYLKFDLDKDFIKSEEDYFKDIEEKEISDYERSRADRVLYYLIKEDSKKWNVKIIENSSCFRGVATKNNTIIYMIYCD